MKDDYPLFDEQRCLLVDLLEAHLAVLTGDVEAIRGIPELGLVASEGTELLEERIELVRRTLEVLR